MGRKSKGNVMDLVTIGITILAMSIVVAAYLECSGLMLKKLEVSQLSRHYILKMETEGYLNEQNRQMLLQELQALGMQGIDLTGTTLHPVAYGETILLHIKGNINAHAIEDGEDVWSEGFLSKQFTVEENRMSTAKN
ncbi:MAG: hypothetical protein IJ379_00500 [Lachnospiraceae bacterium]|nr:hypothetical protein [Lachnospiraceae bacterium]